MPISENEDANIAPESPIQIKDWATMDPSSQDAAAKQVVDDLMKKFERWRSWRQPYERLWTEIYAAYMSVLRKMKVSTRARVFVPIAFQIIEAAVPKLTSIIFGQSEWFDVVPEDPETADDVSWILARTIRNVLRYQFAKADFFLKFVDFAKQLLLYGTSYFYVYWKVRREWVWEKEPTRQNVTEAGHTIEANALSWKKTKSYKVVERRPEVEILDTSDVYPDPDSRSEDPAYCTGLFVMSSLEKQAVTEMGGGRFPVYANTDKLENVHNSNPYPPVKRDRQSIRGTGQPNPSGEDAESVELLTYWGKYDLDGDGIREECMIVVANRQVLLKAIPNPFEHQKRPVIRAVLFSVPLEWFGMGIIEPVLPLIHELNTLRNQSIDVNNLIINRMWKVNSLADVDLDTLISAPNGIILTDQMDGIDPIRQDPLPGNPDILTQMIQRDIENTTTPKSVQGAPDSGTLGRTAKGASMIIGQALEKFGLASRILEESPVKRVLQMFHQLNIQFIDNDEVWSKEGLYGQVYTEGTTPEMLRADVQFKMLGMSETVTKESKINQIISFLSVFKDVPGLNLIEMARVVWTLMDTSEPADKVIQQAPFPQNLVQQQMPPDVAQAIRNQVQTNGAESGVAIPKGVSQ